MILDAEAMSGEAEIKQKSRVAKPGKNCAVAVNR
jgi:hypothetical protein